ncbi:hypothetical protein CCACVL1_02052, partial [Corchorus capsularis]
MAAFKEITIIKFKMVMKFLVMKREKFIQ